MGIEYVRFEQLTINDTAWLHSCNENHPEYEHLDVDDVLHDLERGRIHLLRLVGDAEGVVLFRHTRHGSNGAGRLEVLRIAGVNTMRAWPEVLKKLSLTAREWDCQAIQTCVYDKRIAAVLTGMGAKAESITLVVEIDDGQHKD